jgi:P27 family predicted phage terminase small subunit
MAGRKPTPTKLKLVSGNPGHRPINTDEPQPKAATARAPAGLSKLALKHWRTVSRQLSAARILTELDKPALVLYCEAWARWRDATDQVEARGMLVKAPSGYPMQNPYLAIANKAFEQMQKMLVEFGMTPSSRSRIQVQEEDTADPFAAFMDRSKK